MSTVRAWWSSSTSASGNAARASRAAPRPAVDILVARVGDDDDDDRSRPSCRSARVGERDVADVRRVERPAEEADHPTPASRRRRDLGARPHARRAERRLELVAGGGRPMTRKPRSVRKMRKGCRAGLRPVDEEVGEPFGVGRERAARAGRARTARRLKSSIPSPVAAETVKTATIRSSSTPSAGGSGQQVDLVQDDDLRPLVEPGAVLGELVVDLAPNCSAGSSAAASITCTRSARALEVREELVAETDALGWRPRSGRGRPRRSAAGRRARRPCRAPAASVVNG